MHASGLLDAFEGTYEGALQHYLGCEVTRDMETRKGTTYLSQTHYAEEILRTYNFWNATLRLTTMQSPTRASTKTTVTSILPRMSFDVIVVLSVA